ncbi:hypothetical protein [Microbispora bryophytorum]|uniref:hypothetical protein n=1 Tax=Microbispora bryophytorum TaxID=1460882 RepID=UPI00115747CD|nr:hypothetical protein [Microbispora bryophytorum]MBD3134940.1 hypothetical protein [Microbispora bryophytorum]TQS08815.1 hypothetical protein FLX07_06120 [Microbispora bryophytorum]
MPVPVGVPSVRAEAGRRRPEVPPGGVLPRRRIAAVAAALAALLAGSAAAAPPDPLLAPRLDARAAVRERPGMWIGASVARGERAVVVGSPRRLVAEIAALADRAGRTVTRVWGGYGGAVVLVPRTEEQAAVLAAPAKVDGLAAVATGGRVIVQPAAFARLSATGRMVVVTHELTHVATAGPPTVPMWLMEGFADYVGYLDSGLPVRTIAAELAADVAADGTTDGTTDGTADGAAGTAALNALPGPADFAARPAQAYEEAWLACRYIAARFGERRLVALYRATLREGIGPALREVLGLTADGLTREWRSYAHERLARP